jgi:DNA-binding GntR family transcriptional regulator
VALLGDPSPEKLVYEVKRVNRGAQIVTAPLDIRTAREIHYGWGRERGWTVPTEQPTTPPAYVRIAAELRAAITAGEYGPGGKIPSESQLVRLYGKSTVVIRAAISILKSEGLIEGRRGSGNYVREARPIARESHGRNMRAPGGSTSPFARDAARAGRRGAWEKQSEHMAADPETAVRLGIEAGAPVMRTKYRFLADDEPIQLSTSYEPLDLTEGTPIEWPDEGGIVGVVARFDAIGVRIDECEERVRDRAASPDEIEALRLPPRRAHVQTIARTYFAAGRAVETADIVVAVGRYELVYRFPVD